MRDDDSTGRTAPEGGTLETMIGFNAFVGYRLTRWSEGFAIVELDLVPHHLNRSGVLHGGVLGAMLDVAMGYSGIFTDEPGRVRRGVTLSQTTTFLGQAKGGRITCEARRRGGGKTVWMSTAEVRDEAGTLLAIGEGTFRVIADQPR